MCVTRLQEGVVITTERAAANVLGDLYVVGIVVVVNAYVLGGFAQLAAVSGSTAGFSIDPAAVDTGSESSVRDLFAAGLRARTVTIAFAWFAINFGYYGVFIWLPQTFGASGTVPAFQLGGVTVSGIYGYFLLIALVQFPGYASAAYLVERIGRKPTLGGYLLASGVFTFVFAAAMPGAGFGLGIEGFWPFFLALLASSFFTLGAWGAIYAYTPELFPTALRATGNGFAGGVGKIAAVVGPILAGALVPVGYVAALLPLAVAFALGGVVVLAFGVETKGTPLE